MQHKFTWDECTAEPDKREIEASVSQTLESGHVDLSPCHEGPVTITLAVTGPLAETLVGNVRCSCGATLAIVRGNGDASHMVIEEVS
ncbi:hypothetical protein NYO91_00770 [Arhodomonas aquaeolei]|uniref:hypothetical protein n=1 Tax=Arhodomonas aquaeolei TaxID=2369 RepID=UPI00216AA51F|nr:hypothetical protein [Arhodomonas aquaeolei]MCS4502600.1 hypothetical protein [Arhodomonas aquaeolei]